MINLRGISSYVRPTCPTTRKMLLLVRRAGATWSTALAMLYEIFIATAPRRPIITVITRNKAKETITTASTVMVIIGVVVADFVMADVGTAGELTIKTIFSHSITIIMPTNRRFTQLPLTACVIKNHHPNSTIGQIPIHRPSQLSLACLLTTLSIVDINRAKE